MSDSIPGTGGGGSGSGAAASPFSNFMQLRSYLPSWAWGILRLISMTGAVGVSALLIWNPELGLPLFWGLIVPLLPAVFMLTPGIWRNVCPLASSNQAPRRLGLTAKRVQKALPTGAAYPIGIGMFIAAIFARKLMFNASGPATAALILGAMGAAFVGGLIYKGKSGWCSSICPLLPVQRLYGQTPFIKVANTQCEPCVGCAKNCYDFSPEQAYLADQYDSDPHYREFRRFFAGVFPGLILGFYLVPGIEIEGAVNTVLHMMMYMAGSMTLFVLLDLVFKGTPNRMPVVFAALAINVYYWFAAPVVLHTLAVIGVPSELALIGGLRAAVVIASLVWIARSIQAERRFLKEQVRMGKGGEISLAPVVVQTVRVHRNIVQRPRETDVVVEAPSPAANSARIEGGDTAPGALAGVEGALAALKAATVPDAARPAPSGKVRREMRIEPEGRTVPLKSGVSLLDALEGCGAEIKAGCRAGACGGDPIAVTEGADCLGPIGDAERATLARLGHAPNTRMACMARVRKAGLIAVELKPQAAGAVPVAKPAIAAVAAVAVVASAAPVADYDRAIERVVIIGNGVAGLTAAETLRKHHPTCEIHMVSRERYASYNRIAVSGLINERAGLRHIGLKPDEWYDAERITQWLNTRATAIDVEQRQVSLATGESLGYDRLIIANGSRAFSPPVDGFGMPGTFVLREASDAMSIRDYAQHEHSRSAVVVGAGLLGLEAAAELRKFGMTVELLSLNEQVLDRQIDRAASDLTVAHLARHGITLVSQAMLKRLRADNGKLCGIDLEDGRQLQAEILVVCAGTRAESELARSAGLACGRGITVDSAMRTSAPHIFAAGDVAEFESQQFGLWSIAVSQGEVAARSALGLPARYESIQPVTALKLQGIEVRSAGAANASGAGQLELLCEGPVELDEDADPQDADLPAYCKLIAEEQDAAQGGDRLIGAVIVGAHDTADELLDAVRRKAPLSSIGEVLGRHRWEVRAGQSSQADTPPLPPGPPPTRKAQVVAFTPSASAEVPVARSNERERLLARVG